MLAELQRRFLDGLFDRDETALALLADGRLDAAQQLAVYRGSVLGTLCRALTAVYPVCARLVGSRYFDALSLRYVPDHRPRSHNLQDYGDRFADFLDGFEPVARELPYLPDVARLEWAWHRAFHAADSAPMEAGALGRVPPEALGAIRLRLHPGTGLLASDYPVDRIWQVNQPEWTGEATVALDEGPVRLLVRRRNLEPRIERVRGDEWALLDAIAGGERLAALADPARFPSFDRLLPLCVARGWIAGLE